MKLTIQATPRFHELSEPKAGWLEFLKELAGEIGEPSDSVDLSFVDDEGIRWVNSKWRGKDRSTDVLSFHYGRSNPDEAEGEEDPFGEILVSVETAREQANRLGHETEQELSLLVIHGLFHIMGMDHEDENEAERMAEAEEPFRKRLADFYHSRS
ncbi:rRNA maturation RNase YbeY [bacterium]|nr:rRNA maturation RNase YbeY [bacterium]